MKEEKDMKIKLDFTIWIKFAQMVSTSIFEAVNSTNVDWEAMGLKELLTDPTVFLAKHLHRRFTSLHQGK